MSKMKRVSERFRMVRAHGDLDLVVQFLREVPEVERTYLLNHVAKTDELRVYNGAATAAEIRAEHLARDSRTPEAWRQWLARSRQLFCNDPTRVAEQYFYLSQPGRNAVFFAMTPAERSAMKRLAERRWHDCNAAFSEQRYVNRQRREPVEQTA
jgi:hypothetical protein